MALPLVGLCFGGWQPTVAAEIAASLSKRKDISHRQAYSPNRFSEWRKAMRIFERLRTILGFSQIGLQDDSKKAHDGADVVATPHLPSAAETMCCGHCSGNAEGHVSELPNAR
jgi:hypothetical protein